MHSGRTRSNRLTGFARRLRHDQTDAERKLWSRLRNGQLDGWKFRRQVPVAGYIVDFYCVEARLVVELDGGQHAEPQAVRYDAIRTTKLNGRGIAVLRFSDIEMLTKTDAVVRCIYDHLRERTEPSPQPSPGVPGEGAGKADQ